MIACMVTNLLEGGTSGDGWILYINYVDKQLESTHPYPMCLVLQFCSWEAGHNEYSS